MCIIFSRRGVKDNGATSAAHSSHPERVGTLLSRIVARRTPSLINAHESRNVMAALSGLLVKTPRGNCNVTTGTGHRERQECGHAASPLSIRFHRHDVAVGNRKNSPPRCRMGKSHNASSPAYQVAKARIQPPHSYQGGTFASTSRVSTELQLQYERKGHVCLRQLFSAHEMDELLEALRTEALERELDAFR